MGSQYNNKFASSFMKPDASNRIQAFRFTSNQKERVIKAMNDNSNLDGSPTNIHTGQTYESIMQLRKRDKSKELSSDMKYKANTYAQKIVDTVKYRNASHSINNNELFAGKLLTKRGELRKGLVPAETQDVSHLMESLGMAGKHTRSHQKLGSLKSMSSIA